MDDLSHPLPHPSKAECEAILRQVEAWALNHHATLSEQPIGHTARPAEMQMRLAGPPPESGPAFADVLDKFRRDVAPFAFNIMHPRFLAFIGSAPTIPSIAGDWLCAAANYFAGVWLEAAGPTQVELTVLDWFKEWLGYPKEARGILTSGGSEANLTALVVARERVPFEDRRRMILYHSAQRHRSIDRAAMVMGTHAEHLRAIPDDANFQMRAGPLRTQIRADRAAGLVPWAVVANAGATNTGTIDALREVAACCREEGLWLHVDAAYGWAAVLTSDGRNELAGISEADSITLDPHKWLAQTFEAGCLLVRDGQRLEDAFRMRPDYMQDVAPQEGEVNFADHGVALSRRFRALKIWVSIHTLGLGWFRALVDRCCCLADYAQRQIEAAGCFEILCPRRLSVVCFRYVPRHDMSATSLDEVNQGIARDLLATGRAFLSSTRLAGRFALRMCFINWRTTSRDVDEIITLLREIGSRIGS